MRILFIFAHPDDEAYGPAGTIAKLSVEHDVTVVSLCNGARPGSEHVSKVRTDAFIKSCNSLGARWKIYDTPDCTLNYADTLKSVEMLISHYQPEVVYTHSITDVHQDHRLVAEACLVACRPKPDSSVSELYFSEMPASTSWSFGKINGIFDPSVYNEVDINVKKTALSYYTTEVYNFPDARSIEAVEVLSKHRGYQSGFNYAEAFQLVFSRNRKIQ